MGKRWNFTPVLTTGKRIRLLLSDDDLANIERGNCAWVASVTDLNTGFVAKVQGAECDLPDCYCDAVVNNTDEWISQHTKG